jgi:hypothetical protein
MLSRYELDRMGCGVPNCTHDHSVLYLRAACHPHAGAEVAYEKERGAVIVRCLKCKQLVGALQVARTLDPVQ